MTLPPQEFVDAAFPAISTTAIVQDVEPIRSNVATVIEEDQTVPVLSILKVFAVLLLIVTVGVSNNSSEVWKLTVMKSPEVANVDEFALLENMVVL